MCIKNGNLYVQMLLAFRLFMIYPEEFRTNNPKQVNMCCVNTMYSNSIFLYAFCLCVFEESTNLLLKNHSSLLSNILEYLCLIRILISPYDLVTSTYYWKKANRIFLNSPYFIFSFLLYIGMNKSDLQNRSSKRSDHFLTLHKFLMS